MPYSMEQSPDGWFHLLHHACKASRLGFKTKQHPPDPGPACPYCGTRAGIHDFTTDTQVIGITLPLGEGTYTRHLPLNQYQAPSEHEREFACKACGALALVYENEDNDAAKCCPICGASQ